MAEPLAAPPTLSASVGELLAGAVDHAPIALPTQRQFLDRLLGGLVRFGWEKEFGGYDEELAWWEARAVEGARLL